MRQAPNKRPRGRNGRKPNVPSRHQSIDSSGPEVRIRGNAHQVHEKYLTLARDATTSGDRIAAENFFQHAEHYFRIINASTDPQPPGPPQPTGLDERHGDAMSSASGGNGANEVAGAAAIDNGGRASGGAGQSPIDGNGGVRRGTQSAPINGGDRAADD